MARPLPWRQILACSLLGVIVMLACIFVSLRITGRGPIALLDSGAAGPSAALIAGDFPHDRLLPNVVGSDGQQYYAIAARLPHLSASAPALDRPRYRLQRIGLPVLGRMLSPKSRGTDLVLALLAANLIGVALLCGGAAALLAVDNGRLWWAPALVGVPGVYMSLRTTTADLLGLGLCLAAVAVCRCGHPLAGAVVAAAAVLTREVMLLALVGLTVPLVFGSARGTSTRARLLAVCALVIVPTVALGAWALTVRAAIPQVHSLQIHEFAWPFMGLLQAAQYLWRTQGAQGAAIIVIAVVLIALGLSRATIRWGPYGVAIGLQALLLSVLASDNFKYIESITRDVLPVMVFVLLGVATSEGLPLTGRKAILAEQMPVA